MNNQNNYSTFSMSVPIIFQSLFQILFGLADTWFLSFYSDSLVACAGYANQIISVILLSFVIISSSVSIIGAQYIGEKRMEDSRRLSSDAIACTVFVSIVLSILLLTFSESILRLLRVPSSMRPATETYFRVICTGLAFQGGNAVFTSICRIYGKARFAMYVGVFTNILNIAGDGLVILNPLSLSLNPVLGVAGATVLSNLAGFVVMAFFCTGKRGIKIGYGHAGAGRIPGCCGERPAVSAAGRFRVSLSNIRLLAHYGVPSAGENISYKVSQLVVTILLTTLGGYVLSARIYAMNIMLFVSLIPNSMGIATGIIAGYLFGEKKYDELYRRCYRSIAAGIAIVAALDLVMIAGSGFFLTLFTQDQAILRIARQIVYFEAFTLFFKTGNFMFGNSLRGVGDVYYCTILSAVSMWILGVGAAWLLGIGLHLGIAGIYTAFCLDEAFRCAMMWRRWSRRGKQAFGRRAENIPDIPKNGGADRK